MTRFPITEWRVEQCRLTAFPAPAANARRVEWWEELAGVAPDDVKTNPKKGSSVATGLWGPGKLVLKQESDRIDWLLLPPNIEVDEAVNEFPQIGTLAETVGRFSHLIDGWLSRNDIPDIVRLAWGVVLIHPEQNRESGYRRLSDYLPIRVVPEASDFFFQLNLPVPSGTIQGLQLNRLSRWSVVELRVITFRITGTGATSDAVAPFIHALRLELDMNTAADFRGPIARDSLRAVCHELMASGEAVATKGLVDDR